MPGTAPRSVLFGSWFPGTAQSGVLGPTSTDLPGATRLGTGSPPQEGDVDCAVYGTGADHRDTVVGMH
jgi:hypothetical protein